MGNRRLSIAGITVAAIALAVVIGLVGRAATTQKGPSEGLPVTIALAHGDEPEQATRSQLVRLLRAHDVRPWVMTDRVVIESGRYVTPHSHPVLTLSTRHLRDDELLLSTFVHEQLHWFMDSRAASVNAAVAELKALFPRVPVGFPDGAMNESSTYQHLLLCALEIDAVKRLLGELRARQVLEFWVNDHYRWIYRIVLERKRSIDSLITKHGLDPTRETRH